MTLIKAILSKNTLSEDHIGGKKYMSPPPEITEEMMKPKRKKKVFKYAHVKAKVDNSPPMLDMTRHYRQLQFWRSNQDRVRALNYELLVTLRKAQLARGKVDSHWSFELQGTMQYYRSRVDYLKRIQRDNFNLYKRLTNAQARVETAASHRRDWIRHKKEMVIRAENEFVLFKPIPEEIIEDSAFRAPPGVKRPRVYMTIGIVNCAAIGELCLELFTDVCPQTCQLFTDLLDGDKLGHGYVGTCFFRKVPHLYWSGGDVIHDNGFGCYAQKGKKEPIGAENYHFSHAMPGLLSMNVTCDDEVCGIFNITFKALPQFDLRNIVFGRVVRPSATYDMIKTLGTALSTHPVTQIRSTRRMVNGKWVTGEPNTRLTRTSQLKARKALARRR